jgi:hypothetical protein
VADPLARERIPWSEAAAHRGTGDLAGAAARAAALGARATALRLRLALSPDSSWRAGMRRELTALVAARRSPGEVRDAIGLLDSAFAPLTAAEELEVGRAASTAGSHIRAVAAFERAFAARLGTAEDRLSFATAFARLGRYTEAAPQFALVHGPRDLAASAAYQWARALVRSGRTEEGRAAHRPPYPRPWPRLFHLPTSPRTTGHPRPELLATAGRALPQQPVGPDRRLPRGDDHAARRRRARRGRRVRRAGPALPPE